MSVTATTSEAQLTAEHDDHPLLRRHLKRNFLAHSLDGGVYIGGMAFLSGAMVLPKIVESLGGPKWVIAAIPLLGIAGFQLPSLLTAHFIERLQRLRPLLLLLGVVQRLPALLTALVLIFLADTRPGLVLAAVVLRPFISGLFGGMGQTAWQELVANSIPTRRRSSLWATRNMVATLIGLTAGAAVTAVLRRWPGTTGYGVLHLITFACLATSYVFFAFTREVPNPRPAATDNIGLIESLRRMPSLVVADPRFRRYLLTIMFAAGMGVMTPFLSIHALKVLGQNESYLGVFVVAQMLGGVAGNVSAAILGDRYGGKRVVVIALALLLATCIWSMTARTAWEFWAISFLFGAGTFTYMVGRGTLNLEVCSLHHRVRYLAIMNAAGLAGSLLAWAVSATAMVLSGGLFHAVAALASISMAMAIVMVAGIAEPRQREQTA